MEETQLFFNEKLSEYCVTAKTKKLYPIVKNTPYKNLADELEKYVITLIADDEDPREFIEEYVHLALCKYQKENFDQYWIDTLIVTAKYLVNHLETIKNAVKTYKEIDWIKVRWYIDWKDPKVKKEDWQTWPVFDTKFLKKLHTIRNVIVRHGYHKYLGKNADVAEMLLRVP